MNKCTPLLLLPAMLAGCADEPAHLELEVLSTRPWLVTGGDALLEVTSSSADHAGLLLSVNGALAPVPVVPAGPADEGLYRYRALVSELALGDNVIQVSEGEHTAQLTVVNYAASGPVISGDPQSPYFCLGDLAPSADGSTRRFAIGNGDFLAPPAGPDCSVPTRVDYVYRSATGEGFSPLPDPQQLPPDALTTVTSEGLEVPFVVRIETGSINRAIYQTAVLHNPARDPDPLAAADYWNGRLVYTFGGGCEAGYFQGTSTGGVLRESVLAQGYAVASSTLNVNAQGGCNDVLSAETAMMVKEHFSETYGPPRYTIGNGGSGGAMQQLLIAGAYPGILDGIIPSMTFPDAVTYLTDSEECSVLLRRFANDPALQLSDEVKAALGGWPNWYLCDVSLGERPHRASPYDCPDPIPEAARYDSTSNPDGARCSIYDGMRNVFGERPHPDTGRPAVALPHDNIGVQYGLAALNAGIIDKALFLALNEQIGGWDADLNPTPTRTAGDAESIRIAYETGRVTSGSAGLSQVPIIDDRLYLDHQGNFHASIYSFTTRARLARDNGHADNYVIRRHGASVSLADENLALMDEWLARIQADRSDLDPLQKIVRARPETLQDDCFTESGERIVETARFDMGSLFDNTAGRCNTLYPPHAGLRLVAGGPLSNDVLKCALKPVDYGDYRVEFTAEEKARLETVFPQGVCDWEQPGEYQTANLTWLSFGPSPVNQYRTASPGTP